MPTITRALPFFLLPTLALLAGCGPHNAASPGTSSSGTTPTASSGKRVSVYLLPKKKGIAYFSSCADGAQAGGQGTRRRGLDL